MKNRLIDKIGVNLFWIGLLLMTTVSFVPLKQEIKYIIAPIAVTLWGLSLVILIFSSFWKFKIKDYDYFRNVLIGIFGGLTVWFFSTIDFSFPNGIMLGINGILVKLGYGMIVLVIGYKLLERKEKY